MRDNNDEGNRDAPDVAADEGRLEGEIVTAQSILDKAKDHVKQYKHQRILCNQIIDNARNDVLSNVIPPAFKRKVITIDMGQNLQLPNFPAEQPGDAYYLSPLTIYLVGIVDNASFDEKSGKFLEQMGAFVWKEGEADRGANNICSCLLKYFQKKGWLHKKNSRYTELTIVADNCGGQTKNKHVVRFQMWLVEAGYFAKIVLLFLVKGHTKNACDRMFNLVKLGYHKKNTYTYSQLLDCMNEHDQIDVTKMEEKDMFNFLEWQDKHYKQPTGGSFKRTHLFTFTKQNLTPTLMLMQDDCNTVVRVDNLLPTSTRQNAKAKKMTANDRKIAISSMLNNLNVLKSPGIRPIKQVELYTKWRTLIPDVNDREETCPRPSDEILESVKKQKNSKAAAKAAAKRRKIG